jgi:hypothetical protein
MAHIIAEAIIENGKLTYVDKKLPPGRIRAHIIYDIDNLEEERGSKVNLSRIVKETHGIYRHIRPETESRALRKSWGRGFEN